MIYNWANNSLTSKGYEQHVHTWLHAALAMISKQAHLLTTSSLNTVQFKVNGTDPYKSIAVLIGYSYVALVCVEYGLSRGQYNHTVFRCLQPTTTSLA